MIRIRIAAVVFTVAAIAVGCGSAAVTPGPPTPAPTPTPTPDPHLSAPASVDKLYQELRKSGLSISANTADLGEEPRKTLNLTYDAWPLIIEEYSTADALVKNTGFDPKKKPEFGDAPYSFAGLNIFIAYGPQVQRAAPVAPDARFATAALLLARALDPLIGPLQQSSVDADPAAAGRADTVADADREADEDAETDQEAQAG